MLTTEALKNIFTNFITLVTLMHGCHMSLSENKIKIYLNVTFIIKKMCFKDILQEYGIQEIVGQVK